MMGCEVNVKSIMEGTLRRMGADGLCSEIGECGCDVGDLMPCDEPCDGCVPAKRARCPECGTPVYIPLAGVCQNPGRG